jgi:hypothetical protein
MGRSRKNQMLGGGVDDDDGREGTYRNIVNANNDSVRNNHNLSNRC